MLERKSAHVPATGIPKRFPARTLLVDEKPPIKAARVPQRAASNSWARLVPNSKVHRYLQRASYELLSLMFGNSQCLTGQFQ